MTKDFKKLSQEVRTAEPRAAIPQVDPEAPKPTPAAPLATERPTAEPRPMESRHQGTSETPADRPVFLTPVDTTEEPSNHGFHMYPSRHTQVVRDLTYLEDRKPWQIIEDALEEYVVKHYGKEHKRK